MISSRARIVTTVIGVAAVAGAVAAVAVALSSVRHPPPDAPAAITVPTPSPIAAPTPTITGSPSQAPVMPAHGAYLGAYVEPSSYGQPEKIAAIRAFQHQIGQRLAIVHSYLRWGASFPTPTEEMAFGQGSTLLLSWTGTDTQAVASGRYDAQLRQDALAMKATHKRILLEWRWEMNRLALHSVVHSARDYIRAWDHVRAIFKREKVGNVAWVWCPSSKGWGNVPGYLPAQDFYPGNSEVDWLCADVYPRIGGYSSFSSIVRPFLAWASHIDKPILFGEVGAPRSYTPQQRAHWLRDMAKTARGDHQIKALIYFDGSPPGRPSVLQYGLAPGSAPLRTFRDLANQPYFRPSGAAASP